MSNTQKPFHELTFIDNFMFITVMQNPKNSKKFLEILFGMQIDRVEITGEHEISYHPKHRGVRLDVYIKDEKNTRYNIELQAFRKDSLVKRTRYYHSQIDMSLISTGTKYKELPDVFVIFICDFDPFGKNKYCYTVKNKCIEDDTIDIEDGITSIYLSTKGKNKEEVSEEIFNFLDFVCAQSEGRQVDLVDDFVKQLHESIEEIKQSRELGETYMGLKEWLEDEYEDGKAAGIEEGREAGIAEGREAGIAEGREAGIAEGREAELKSLVEKKLAKGMSLEEIADFLEKDIDEIRVLTKELTKN